MRTLRNLEKLVKDRVQSATTPTNIDTGVAQSLHTNDQGYYSLQSLALDDTIWTCSNPGSGRSARQGW